MIQEVTKAETKSDALTEMLIFVLITLISTFLLRLVWNRSLVKHITAEAYRYSFGRVHSRPFPPGCPWYLNLFVPDSRLTVGML